MYASAILETMLWQQSSFYSPSGSYQQHVRRFSRIQAIFKHVPRNLRQSCKSHVDLSQNKRRAKDSGLFHTGCVRHTGVAQVCKRDATAPTRSLLICWTSDKLIKIY